MHDFFISYSCADEAWARWIVRQLSEAGYTCESMALTRPGQNWVLRMNEGMSSARRTLIVLSPSFVTSAFTQSEWAGAYAQDPRGDRRLLIPIRVRKCKLEGMLAQVAYADLVGLPETEARQTLLDAVAEEESAQAVEFPGVDSPIDDAPFPGRWPSIENIPYRRYNGFVGREQELEELGKLLFEDTAAVAICGLGGVGKTQLALEFVHRHSHESDLIWWLRAEELQTLRDDYLELGRRLGLSDDILNGPKGVRATRQELDRRGGWFLVFDNAPGPQPVVELLPRSDRGVALITSRWRLWRGAAEVLDLRVLKRSESEKMIVERVLSPKAEEAERELLWSWSDQLAEKLGDLPLALEQATAYIEETGLSIKVYLELFEERRSELLQRGAPINRETETVATTWEVSLVRLQDSSPASVSLLQFCSFLAPQAIPEVLFEPVRSEFFPEPLSSVVRNPIAFRDTVGAAANLSLLRLKESASGMTGFAMHRLVQSVIREGLEPQVKSQIIGSALKLLDSSFDPWWADPGTWPKAEALMPHVNAVIHRAQVYDAVDSTWARLRSSAGLFAARRRGTPQLAESHLRASLAWAENAYGSDDVQVALLAVNLALILRELGKLDESLQFARGALATLEKNQGSQRSNFALAASSLGLILHDLGYLEEAQQFAVRGLEIDLDLYGAADPNYAARASTLAWIIKDLGRLEEARALAARGESRSRLSFAVSSR